MRAAARSLSLDSGLYASAHISKYPGNVINGDAAISSPHEPYSSAKREDAETLIFHNYGISSRERACDIDPT